jgi:hypothetical protein
MKTFQVMVEDSARTRWLISDEELAEVVRSMVIAAAAHNTTGAVPLVRVRVVTDNLQTSAHEEPPLTLGPPARA